MIVIPLKNIEDLPDHTLLELYRGEIEISKWPYLMWREREDNELNIMTLETEILKRMKKELYA